MEIFRKELSSTDISKRLSIPSHALHHFDGIDDVPVRDWTGRVWTFHLYKRSMGHPKPVFTGEWARFAQEKHLKADDTAIFRLEDGQFTIEVSRATNERLFGQPLNYAPVL